MAAKSRVFIVDDHPIVRAGFAGLLAGELDLQLCGEAADVQSALEKIPQARPDLVLVDVSLKGTSGLELVKRIKSTLRPCVALVLSMHEDLDYAERALRAGARGYIMKQETPDEILRSIRRVLAGEIYVSERVAVQLLETLVEGQPRADQSPLEVLGDRELEVLRLLGSGRGSREIAHELCLSIKTVESHRANIKTKLSLPNSAQLIRFAIRWVEGHRESRKP